MEASPSSAPGLKRSLSVWAALGLSVALMAPSMAANINPQGSALHAGRAVPLTFLIAAVGVLLVAYSFVRLCQLGAALAAREGIAAPGTEEPAPPARRRAGRDTLVEKLLPCVAEQPLVDHHCHGVLRRDADLATLESMLTEGDSWPGGSVFDSQAGFVFRRLCPPVLGLPPHAELGDYVARRAELGATEVSKRFLAAAGVSALCVDTGYVPEPITSPAELGDLADATAHEIVRLERVAEDVAAAGVGAAGFADAFRSALATRTAAAAGVKSIAAYRTGLDLRPERPSDAEVAAAAGRWLASSAEAEAGPPRLADQTLQRFLVWCGVDLRLPVQFHVGYGDSDVDLHRCNPLLLTPLLRAIQPTGVPVMLLHNYPFHREAGYLAQVFPHVYVDAGLATHNLGFRAPALLAEALELAPFGKFLYSSDAFGLPELYYLGSALFRSALSAYLRTGLDQDIFTERAAVRVTRMLSADNAKRAYQLGDQM
jgi:predicted TIM-barrel fold metal-dependent hydrolase